LTLLLVWNTKEDVLKDVSICFAHSAEVYGVQNNIRPDPLKYAFFFSLILCSILEQLEGK